MKTAAVVLLGLCLVFGSAQAQDRINWALSTPMSMSETGPYFAHIQFTSEGDRTIRARLFDLDGSVLSTELKTVGAQDNARTTLVVKFDQTLVIGRQYRVQIALLSSSGTELAQNTVAHTVVREHISLLTGFDSLPALTRTYPLRFTYTATERRSIVVAIKDLIDFNYRGSVRAYVEPGVNARGVVMVNFGGPAGGLLLGQRVIARIDIRPVDATAAFRLDRDERIVTATSGTATTPPTPTPTPTPTVAPTPTATATPTTTPAPYFVTFVGNPRTIPCGRYSQEIAYRSATGPIRVQLIIRSRWGRWLGGRSARNIPAGSGRVTVTTDVSDYVRPGELYIVDINIRLESAASWRDKLASVWTRPVRAVCA